MVTLILWGNVAKIEQSLWVDCPRVYES
jgi:hypothetical protein